MAGGLPCSRTAHTRTGGGRVAWLTRLLAERALKKEGQGGQGGPLLAERAHQINYFEDLMMCARSMRAIGPTLTTLLDEKTSDARSLSPPCHLPAWESRNG